MLNSSISKKKDGIQERFISIPRLIGITEAQFFQATGIKKSSFYNVKMKKTSVTLDQILLVNENLNISIGWLTTGEGDMYGHTSTYESRKPSKKELLEKIFPNAEIDDDFLYVCESMGSNRLKVDITEACFFAVRKWREIDDERKKQKQVLAQ